MCEAETRLSEYYRQVKKVLEKAYPEAWAALCVEDGKRIAKEGEKAFGIEPV